MSYKRNIGIAVGVVIILFVSYFALSTLGTEDTYSGIFIRANKVYMPDNNIKLVIYFNVSSDDITFVIFDNWDARHSVQLSNMEEGANVRICYKEYVVGGDREIVRIDIL